VPRLRVAPDLPQATATRLFQGRSLVLKDSNPLSSQTPLDDYILLREYLVGGGTIDRVLSAAWKIERDLKASDALASDETRRTLDLAAMLGYGLTSIDYFELDKKLDGLRQDYGEKAADALPVCDRVDTCAAKVLSAFATMESCCEYDPGLVPNQTGIQRFQFSLAFTWLSELKKLSDAREESEAYDVRAKRCAAIAKVLQDSLPEGKARAHSMIQRRFRADVAVEKNLNNYQVAAGKTGAYVEALGELDAISADEVAQAIDRLSMWSSYTAGWWNRFNQTLDHAYATHARCLVADSQFWREQIQPLLETE